MPDDALNRDVIKRISRLIHILQRIDPVFDDAKKTSSLVNDALREAEILDDEVYRLRTTNELNLRELHHRLDRMNGLFDMLHVVTFDHATSDRIAEMAGWASENMEGRFTNGTDPTRGVWFAFNEMRDAVHFRLRWAGEV